MSAGQERSGEIARRSSFLKIFMKNIAGLFALTILTGCYQLDHRLDRLEKELEILELRIAETDHDAVEHFALLAPLDSLRRRIDSYPGNDTDETWQRLRAESSSRYAQLVEKFAEPDRFARLFLNDTSMNRERTDDLLRRYRILLEADPNLTYESHFGWVESLLLESLVTYPPQHRNILLLKDQYAWLQAKTLERQNKNLRPTR